jgi:hypothetical protein
MLITASRLMSCSKGAFDTYAYCQSKRWAALRPSVLYLLKFPSDK